MTQSILQSTVLSNFVSQRKKCLTMPTQSVLCVSSIIEVLWASLPSKLTLRKSKNLF